MRLLLCICCIALVLETEPGIAQNVSALQAPAADADVAPNEPALARVGRVSLVAGNVSLRRSDESGWADAEPNQPIFAGVSVRTDPRARSEIGIGANTISLSNATE